MKAAEITDTVIDAIQGGDYKFIRLNYPNGDMVGHTGVPEAVEIAVETVDLCVARLIEAIRKSNGMLIVTADHGNSDDMFQRNKKSGDVVIDEGTGKPAPKTAHSLNPVPIYIFDPTGTVKIKLADQKDLGISSIAATCLRLLGFEPPQDYTPSIVDIK